MSRGGQIHVYLGVDLDSLLVSAASHISVYCELGMFVVQTLCQLFLKTCYNPYLTPLYTFFAHPHADHQLLVTVPALIGLGRAIQCSISGPSSEFRKLFDQTSTEGEGAVWELDEESSVKLFKMVGIPLYTAL